MKLPKVGFHCKLMLVMYLNGFEKWQEKELFSFWHSTLFIIYHSVRVLDNVTTLVISSEWSSTTVYLPLIKRHVGNPQSSYGSSNSEYCSCSSKFRFEPCSFKIFSTVSCELNNNDAFRLQVKLCAAKVECYRLYLYFSNHLTTFRRVVDNLYQPMYILKL